MNYFHFLSKAKCGIQFPHSTPNIYKKLGWIECLYTRIPPRTLVNEGYSKAKKYITDSNVR